jgi:ferredoxin--NADP+ reductase
MARIIEKRSLTPVTKLFRVEAPLIAAAARPGQFVIVRVREDGERIPLTIADYDRAAGVITIVVQEVGVTTRHLGALAAGQEILDLVGPLGTALELPVGGHVVGVGGGLDAVCRQLELCTDDGSVGFKGFVTERLQLLIEGQGPGRPDCVLAIGPMPMMRAVADTTRAARIPTQVSMDPLMIDGTGMCGGCRVTVDGEVKFACVDGPFFDAHLVDFDEAVRRKEMYLEEEQRAACRQAEGRQTDAH